MPRLRFLYILMAMLSFAVNGEQPQDYALASMVEVEEERLLDAIVEAVNQATVSAQTTGRVVKINVDVDDTVQKGDVLIQFRDKDQKAAFNAAKASLEEATAELKRVKDIYANKLVAKAVLDKANAGFKVAQAKYDQAKEALENTMVRAPYSGIVVKRHIEVGELARPGQKLMTGLSLEALRAKVALPQDMINVVRKNGKATAVMKDGQRVTATKITISPYADPESHTFQVRLDLPQTSLGVYPGMFIKVAFVTAIHKRLLVPASAIAQRSEVKAVYVVSDNNQLRFRQVRVGKYIAASKRYEILAGLVENEKVMLDPVAAAARLKQQEK